MPGGQTGRQGMLPGPSLARDAACSRSVPHLKQRGVVELVARHCAILQPRCCHPGQSRALQRNATVSLGPACIDVRQGPTMISRCQARPPPTAPSVCRPTRPPAWCGGCTLRGPEGSSCHGSPSGDVEPGGGSPPCRQQAHGGRLSRGPRGSGSPSAIRPLARRIAWTLELGLGSVVARGLLQDLPPSAEDELRGGKQPGVRRHQSARRAT